MFEAEKRVRRRHSSPVSATASVNITPVPAFAVSSPAAGPALGPASTPLIAPFSLLPINAVSASSPTPAESLAVTVLPISQPAVDVSAIRLVSKDASFDYRNSDSSLSVRSAVLKTPSLIRGPSFMIRPTAMPAPSKLIVAPTPIFPYRSASSPVPLSTAQSILLP